MSSIATPPPTTLSTPSPTEHSMPRSLSPPAISSAASSRLKPIYVIVATTPITTTTPSTSNSNSSSSSSSKTKTSLGIGLQNSLPWPNIKSDMAFFKNATIKTRPRHSTTDSNKTINAVIMGRKTWDSIPPRFRPLAERVNVVISRRTDLASSSLPSSSSPSSLSSTALPSVLHYPSLESALAALTGSTTATSTSTSTSTSSSIHGNEESNISSKIGNIFIMGGAQIYSAFLALPPNSIIGNRPVRILQTQVRRRTEASGTSAGTPTPADKKTTEFECDTFFPLALEEQQEEDSEGKDERLGLGLRQIDEQEIQDDWLWTESGENVILPQYQHQQDHDGEGHSGTGWFRDDKVGVEVRVVGWER